MKITDVMLERGLEAFEPDIELRHHFTEDFRAGLEAAFDAVPDPTIPADWVALEMEKRIAEKEVKHAHERIADLEVELLMQAAELKQLQLRAKSGALTPTVLKILDEERDAREPSAASLREIPEASPDALSLGRGATGLDNARKLAEKLQKAYHLGYKKGQAGLSENNILATDADRIGRILNQLERGKCWDSDVRYLLMLVEDLNDRLARIEAHVEDKNLPDDEALLFISGVLDDRFAHIPEDKPNKETP